MNVDQDKWQIWVENNQDAYGAAAIRYAERWANMMETAMVEGNKLEDVAKSLSHEADTEHITGFMYGAAVAILANCWEYGERLRKWHNLNTQIHGEGERANESGKVLNPARLCLSTA